MLVRLKRLIRKCTRVPLWACCILIVMIALGLTAWDHHRRAPALRAVAARHANMANGYRIGELRLRAGGVRLENLIAYRETMLDDSQKRVEVWREHLGTDGLTDEDRRTIEHEIEALEAQQQLQRDRRREMNASDSRLAHRYLDEAARFAAVAEHHERIAQSYESAARFPWILAPTAPPRPSLDP